MSIQIVFSQPFQGTLFYTVGGSVTSEDISPLSGEVQVDDLSTMINVQVLDNIDLNELRYLTLGLSGGPGYVVGAGGLSGFVIGDGNGLFPDGECEASVSRTDTAFSLSVSSAALSAGSSMLNTEALLSLNLSANLYLDPETDEMVPALNSSDGRQGSVAPAAGVDR